jgi:hypothetical protein
VAATPHLTGITEGTMADVADVWQLLHAAISRIPRTADRGPSRLQPRIEYEPDAWVSPESVPWEISGGPQGPRMPFETRASRLLVQMALSTARTRGGYGSIACGKTSNEAAGICRNSALG